MTDTERAALQAELTDCLEEADRLLDRVEAISRRLAADRLSAPPEAA